MHSLGSLAKYVMLARADSVRTCLATPVIGFWAEWPKVIVLLLTLWIGAAHAEALSGKVIHVADGDTITILSGGVAHRVRLAGIDAPEKGQAFGNRSRQNLAQIAHGKDATLQCHKTDRYRRNVCKVWVRPADCPTCGHTLDVGLAQIAAGLAWWYREYAREQSPEDRRRYESDEHEAKTGRRELWAVTNPVAPCQWRKKLYLQDNEQ